MSERDAADHFQIELLRRIAAADSEALGTLYDETSGVLYSVAFRMLGNTHDAEEVIQDVFVQIWEKSKMFNTELGSPLSWLFSITRNRSIDRIRARQRRLQLADESLQTAERAGEAASAAGDAQAADLDLCAIRSAVATLPVEQRRAIEMAFFSGMTHAEIVEATGEPLGTIKARIRRGLLKLRENLERFV
jgi:RNA polymerase sigma-70 factor, ECF subfamily